MTGWATQVQSAQTNSALTVCRLTEQYRSAWDKYVLESSQSTIYHLLGLKDAIETTYHAQTIYLIAIDNMRNVVGVLPLVIVRLPWLTNALVSMPYSPYGGVLSDSESAAAALLREAESIRASLGLGCLMVKGLAHSNFEAFNAEKIHYSMVLDTNRNFDDVWSKSFTKSCRNHCNKATRLGVRIELGNNDRLLQNFYDLYVDQQHRFGTPMHSVTWYQQLRKYCGNHVLFGAAYFAQVPVATVCVHIYRNRMISSNSARNPVFSSTGASNLLRCELIRHACTSGIELFDFARAKCGGGTYHFKSSFGARPKETYYQYVVSVGKRKPATDPADPAFRLPAQIWRKLPRSFVLRFGPVIRKGLAT
jgi:FemAB-related protein (PEP-CTERM system-associated)